MAKPIGESNLSEAIARIGIRRQIKHIPIITNEFRPPTNLSDSGSLRLDGLPNAIRNKVRPDTPSTPMGRPSANLGGIFNNQLQRIDLAARILESNPIPFSVIRTAKTNLTKIENHPAVPWPAGIRRRIPWAYLDKLRGK